MSYIDMLVVSKEYQRNGGEGFAVGDSVVRNGYLFRKELEVTR